MNGQLMVLALLVGGVGLSLVLSEFPIFATPSLLRRLARFTAASHLRHSESSFREVLGPIANQLGQRLATAVGVSGELGVRLQRIGSPLDVTAFRIRQFAYSMASIIVAIAVLAGLGAAPVLIVSAAIGAPILTFLLIEQRTLTASQRWKSTILNELPVVIEQLGMLMSAGYSLGAAINRVATRTNSECGKAMAQVSGRIRQGVSELTALREWADVADIDAVNRLVAVLALNWEASDVGALISHEAREVRRQVQRQHLELIERRSQQVWIPVTVATLVPGVIFMAVPFADAMSKLTGR